MTAAVAAAYWPIRALPDRHALPSATVPLHVQSVELPPPTGPLRLAGAWVLKAADGRFGGISALAIDRGRFLAVTDRGAVVRFDFPTARRPQAELTDLRQGPGSFEKKWARDAESMARAELGRGWWVGFERDHSLWLYDPKFSFALTHVQLEGTGWPDNRGAEGLLARDGGLLVLAENGRQAIRTGPDRTKYLNLYAHAEVADAAKGPDGSFWVLLREKGLGGIAQSIAPLLPGHDGYVVGPRSPVPKGALDNFEGMAIEVRADGGWRFWLVTDDGHRVLARTLLVALDVQMTIGRKDKSPAPGTGLSKKP